MIRKPLFLVLVLGALVLCGRVDAAEKPARVAAAYDRLAELCPKLEKACARERAASKRAGAEEALRLVQQLCRKIAQVPYIRSAGTNADLDMMCVLSTSEIVETARAAEGALADRPDFKATRALWEPAFTDAVSELFYAMRDLVGDGHASSTRPARRRKFQELHGAW